MPQLQQQQEGRPVSAGWNRDEFKERLLAGFCPYCIKGPFTVVLIHVYRVHGVKGREVRDAAGLRYYRDHVADAAYVKECAERARHAGFLKRGNDVTDKPRQMSQVAKRQARAAALGINARRRQQTHCKRGHPLTAANLKVGHAYRACRLCFNMRNVEYKRAKRLKGAQS